MLDAPDKRLFIGIGGLEAASQLLGFVGASKLPGRLADVLRAQSYRLVPAAQVLPVGFLGLYFLPALCVCVSPLLESAVFSCFLFCVAHSG